jgi:hypothetical protein
LKETLKKNLLTCSSLVAEPAKAQLHEPAAQAKPQPSGAGKA